MRASPSQTHGPYSRNLRISYGASRIAFHLCWKRYKQVTAFTFDEHYRQAGFKTLP